VKLIILDRDGVINEDSDEYIKTPEEWEPIPGSLDAIARLNKAGYHVVIATNQSGIARGLFDIEDLHRMHQKMDELLARIGGMVEAVFFCPHGPNEGCDCRKPRPGLFNQIAERLGMTLEGVPAVGDSRRDVEAARAAGATPLLVMTGKGQLALDADEGLEGVAVYRDLAAVADELTR
jgi:D-glycero-D-manno-heptose 1,7-bisphosphate phosphatase